MGSLLNSFKITKLDLEDNNLDNNRLDKTTIYTPNNSGTPTNQANPGKPTNFFQTFVPTNPYLDFVKKIPGKSNLLNLGKLPRRLTILENGVEVPLPAHKYSIFDATNLDIEKSGVNGGIPYKADKDPTVYPKHVTGTPTTQANPGPFAKFNQVFNPTNTYLDKGIKGKLAATVDNTNLDVKTLKPNGGIPYKADKDPTVYPTTTQKKSSTGGFYPVKGQAASKYDQVFNPKSTYLDFIKKYT